MNRTLQDRLVNELKAAGITTVDAANRYLRQRYLPMHNEEFAREAADPTSAFVPLGEVDVDEIFFESDLRKVGKDNTVSVDGKALQIAKQPGRCTCAGLIVELRRHLDGGYTLHRGAQLLGSYDASGRARANRPTHQVPGSTPAPAVDAQLVPAVSSYRRAGGHGAAARGPASARLRLAPAGPRSSQLVSKP